MKGDVSEINNPGEFINIAVPGKYLRRPISLHAYDRENSTMTILYDVVGDGTHILSEIKTGEKLDILVGLGNGFSSVSLHEKPLLLGGGIGCAPLYQLALDYKKTGKSPIVVMGFNNERDIFPMKEWLEENGITSYIATVDGSVGSKGFVTDLIKEKRLTGDYFQACGPMPMLKAICHDLNIPGEVSIESRMGCGFGVCMCCSVQTADGNKRICKDGPVFRKEELLWK